MKPYLFLLLGVTAVALAGDNDTTTPAGPAHGLGRYRLFNGKTEWNHTQSKVGPTTHDTVFKIDSLTGRVWKYGLLIDGRKVTEGFFELHDYMRPPQEYLDRAMTNQPSAEEYLDSK